MGLKVYNTISGKKEDFQPVDEGKVRFYACGVTVYDYCHIGHARSAVVFDTLYRYLRTKGYDVTYVRNFTDIDDKMINRANEEGITVPELADRFIREYYTDADALGIARPTHSPRATKHIGDIIAMILRLIENGHAYESGGDVYYSVRSFEAYGKLSAQPLENLESGARVEPGENKRAPLDFALWKAQKPNEPAWDSPWGPGRPGWHIECSAMSRKYLGNSFDIHGGGKDLVFPHHENELAQSAGASGEEFVRYWVHHGFVTIKDEKMSKSLGNFLTIREVLAAYPAEALRLFIFSTHYRNPLDYSEAAMLDAVAGLNRLYTCLAEVEQLPDKGVEGGNSTITRADRERIAGLAERFLAAMDNDFNSAQALGHLFEAVKVLNKIRQHLPAKACSADLALLRNAAATIRELAASLGLLAEEPLSHMRKEQGKLLKSLDIAPAEIEQLIAERKRAREEKNWGRADEIRDQLLARGVEIKDGPTGTTWQVKVA